MSVLEKLLSNVLIPVVALDDPRDAEGLAQALIAGGLPVAEITFRTPAATESINIMSQFDQLVLGAGTVLTPDQVDQAVEAGASYIVSPRPF